MGAAGATAEELVECTHGRVPAEELVEQHPPLMGEEEGFQAGLTKLPPPISLGGEEKEGGKGK